MKWFVIVLVFLPAVCGNKRFGYRQADVEPDSCSYDDAECVTNQGIQGQCRQQCGALERAVNSDNLCASAEGCKCCTSNSNNCDMIYPGSYCGPAPCDDNKIQISDSMLCDNNYVCCRSENVAVAHPQLRTDTGVKGMKAHYHSFDGLRFTFEGICTYLLMKENTSDSSAFQVWANHARVTDEGGKSRVMVKSLLINANDMVIKLQQGNIGLLVDGVDILAELENNGHVEKGDVEFSFTNNQNLIHVDVKDKFIIDWNGKGHVIVELPDSMIGNEEEGGKVVGLLGNANGERGDDLIEMLYDGTYRIIRILEKEDKPSLEDMIRFGITWMKDCQEVI